MKSKKRKRYVAVFVVASIVVITLIPVIIYLRNKIIEKNMPSMEDFYFLVYEGMEEPQRTIIYKYDVQRDETYEVGRVPGYFHNGEIDSKKEYITGLRGSLVNEENPGAEFGVVRFSLKDGTSEILLTDEEMHTFEEGEIHWLTTYIQDNGKKVFIHYYKSGAAFSRRLLYNLKSGERTEITMPEKRIGGVIDIREDMIWYVNTSGTLIQYNNRTGEKREIIEDIGNAYISDDGTKMVFSRNFDYKHMYLYDVESKEEKCIWKAGWNTVFLEYYQYSSGWDRSGEYCFYVEIFPRIMGNDTRVKIYNLRTGKSRCVYRESKSQGGFEFVRNADV